MRQGEPQIRISAKPSGREFRKMAQLKEENEIKIFILYLLDKIGYPLDYPSIGSIMMQDGIVNFFDFAENFWALVDAGHIKEIVVPADKTETAEKNADGENDEEETEADPTILYQVSDTGREVAEVLSDNIMVAVREKSYRSALRHLSFKKMGAYIDHSYKPDPKGGYILNCTIKENNSPIMDLSVKVDSDYQLDRILRNFSEKPEVVFRGVLALLSGDVNYIFEQ